LLPMTERVGRGGEEGGRRGRRGRRRRPWPSAVALGLVVATAGAGAGQEPGGEALARSLGCGSCHGGVPGGEAIRSVAPAFGEDGVPLAPEFVFEYLDDPERRRPEIAPARMPDFGLGEGERLALALFLAGEPGGGEAAEARARHPELDRDDGARVFRALNCGACHGGTGIEAWQDGPDLAREGARVRPGWLRAYLADPAPIRPAGHRPGLGSRMPDFGLTGEEAEALADYLLSLSSPPASPGGYSEPLTPFRARRTRDLLEDRLSCLGCHALDGEGGRLAPPLDGIGERLNPGWVAAMIHRPRETVPGTPMPRPLFRPETLDEVARLLMHGEGGGEWSGADALGVLELPAWAGEAPEGAARGTAAAHYRRSCAACHGVEGRGDGWNAPFLGVVPTPHANPELMEGRPDDTLFDGIWAGAWVLRGSNRMPAFGGSLGRARVRALVRYIRELCDCQGPAWSRDGRGGGA